VLAVLAVGLIALVTTTLATAPVGAASKQGAPSKQGETPKQFIARLAAAVRTGDTTYLFQHLNPAVIQRYGTSLCRGYLSTLKDPTRKLVVQQIGKPAPFAYASDGESTTVPKTLAVTVVSTFHGQKSTQTVHITPRGTQFTWFTECRPTGTDAVARALGPYTGTYTGKWRDTHFKLGGDMKVVVAIDAVAHALGLQLTFTGPLFGATAPSTEQLAPVSTDIATFGQPVRGTSKIFGPYTVSYTAIGTVTMTMPQCPPGSCSLTGTLTPGSFTGKVSVKLRDGATSQGTVTLHKR
jgi:hypothetical protein